MSDIDPYAAAGALATQFSYLKFIKGDWVAGANSDLVNNKRLVADMKGVQHGWEKWKDKQKVGERMHNMADGDRMELRNDLDEMDSGTWESDDKGQARDPWAMVVKLPLLDTDTGENYLFTSSSQGGKREIYALCGQYARHRPKLPVVELTSDAYVHKQYGRTKIPLLKVVDWADDAGAMAPTAPRVAAPPLKAIPPAGKKVSLIDDSEIPF
jgi:hypothetical protein